MGANSIKNGNYGADEKARLGGYAHSNYQQGVKAIKSAAPAGGPSRKALQDFQGQEAQGISDAVPRATRVAKP